MYSSDNVSAMGLMHATVTVRNPADPTRASDIDFLVDTGAYDCLVPRRQLEAIGLVAKGTRVYRLADGSQLRFDTTVAEVEYKSDVVGMTVIMGADEAIPLLGAIALEALGLEVDPVNKRLHRVPAICL